MGLDLDSLKSDIRDDAPCGDDLTEAVEYVQYDTDFAGKPEQVMGDSVQEAEEPDWRSMRDRALDMLGRTRDLNLLIRLTVASMKLDGLEGLRDGLSLVRWSIETHWEHVYPPLDPDDGDPMARVNALGAMNAPVGTVGDPLRFRERVLDLPLLSSRILGHVTLRDVRRAEDPGAAPGEDGEDDTARRRRIMAIVEDVGAESVTAASESMQQAVDSLKGVDDSLTDKVGASQAANFEDVLHDLREAAGKLSGWAASVAPAAADEEFDLEEFADSDTAENSSGAAPAARPVGVGEIASVSDVRTAFDKIVEYYDRNEPSSPVPVVVKMAQQLLGKSFLDIASVMSPDAIETIERIRESAGGGDDGI